MAEFIQSLPIWTAEAIAVAFFAGTAVVAWLMPPLPREGGVLQPVWLDMRLWATLLLALQCLMYVIF
jgi:hypothetical protein